MAKSVEPFPVVLLGSVLALIVSIFAYRTGGQYGLLGSSFLLNIILGLSVALRFPMNPWRIGIIAVAPNIAFLIWRWVTVSAPEEAALNNSLFVFLPVISLAASYFGGYIGRSVVIRRMRQAKNKDTK